MSRRKRAKVAAEDQAWRHLELGVWEKIFSALGHADLRSAREVCKDFRVAASRCIRQIEIGSMYVGNNPVAACPDTVLSQIPKLPGPLACLESIRVINSQTALPMLAVQLSGLASLTSLHLVGGDLQVTGSMVASLRDLSSLRVLQLEACNFVDHDSMDSLGLLQSLRRLHITKCHPHDLDLVQAIAKLTGLTALALLKPFCFRDQGYSALASLSNLVSLHIGWSWRLGSGSENLAFLSGLRRLRSLDFTKCFVSDADLRWVGQLRDLEQLHVRLCHNVTGTFFGHLGALSRLREVNLEGSYMVTDDGVRALATLTSLQALNMGSSRKISTRVYEALLPLSNLRHLVVPQSLHARPPASIRAQLLPSLETYRCAPLWVGRVPGRIEEHFQELLRREAEVMMDPTISERVLTWFQRSAWLHEL